MVCVFSLLGNCSSFLAGLPYSSLCILCSAKYHVALYPVTSLDCVAPCCLQVNPGRKSPVFSLRGSRWTPILHIPLMENLVLSCRSKPRQEFGAGSWLSGSGLVLRETCRGLGQSLTLPGTAAMISRRPRMCQGHAGGSLQFLIEQILCKAPPTFVYPFLL